MRGHFRSFVAFLTTSVVLGALAALVPVGASAQVPSVVPAVAVSTPGGFTSLAPFRLLDTRDGTGAPKLAVAAHGTVHLQVTGNGGVPASGVSAVVLNVTVTAPTALGFVTVFGADPRPTASSLNFVKGQTVPNLVIAPVRSDGTVDLYNGSTGTAQLIADVSGYYLAGDPTVDGAFGALAPNRLLDTRDGTGAPKLTVAAHGTVHLQVTGNGGVPASGVSAVVLNVTVTAPTSSGFVSVYGDGKALPTASNLNFEKAQTVPNLVIAPVGDNGQVALYNGSGGTVQLIGDVAGWFLDPTAEMPSISGTVTDAEGAHHGLAGVHVQIESYSADAVGYVITAADGTYVVTGYPSATDYQVCFTTSSGWAEAGATGGSADATGYVNQCWHDQPMGSNTPVTVTAGATATGINAALAHGGAESGTVTEAAGTHHGLADVSVKATSSTTGGFGFATTAADGSYTMIGLAPASDYQVCFSAWQATGGSSDATGYVDQCYDNKPISDAATPVAVTVGATKTGINAALVVKP